MVRIEVQTGYTEKNDIKKSKINEANKRFNEEGTITYIVHFNLYNGKAAVIDISNVASNVEYTKNDRFEGAETIELKDEWFKWLLTEKIPALEEMTVKI